MRRIACELRRDRALHPVAILLAGEFAGQRRRATLDADPAAVGLALGLTPLACPTAASSTKELRQAATTTSPSSTTAIAVASAEELAQVKTLGGCITR